MNTRSIRVYSYNGMEWPVTNSVLLAMSDGDYVVYDDVVSCSF